MRHSLLFIFLLCFSLCASCQNKKNRNGERKVNRTTTVRHIAPSASNDGGYRYGSPSKPKSATARHLDSLGLVNIGEADSSIVIHLMYAYSDNFTGHVLYKDLREAYLHRHAARALLRAQNLLRRLHPSYRLLVYDAARPMNIQQEMWDVVKHSPKDIYVSNPAHGGGLHNYGLAVDISIADSLGRPIPMGTKVDHMGYESHIDHESALVRKGVITPTAYRNRLLLRKVMRSAGFRPLRTEWWHFNYCSRKTAKRYYHIIK
jgi:D-alanyl-D-alanine dipeptidase